MNWSRGLFRIWVVLFGVWSALWVIIALWWVNTEVLNGKIYLYRSCSYSVTVSTSATDAEIKSAVEESRRAERSSSYCPQTSGQPDNPFDQFDASEAIAEFRAESERRPAELRTSFLIGLVVWVIPPAVLFALGAAILWAFSGFQKPE